MEDPAFVESNILLYAVADTCNPNHPLFNDRVAIEETAGAQLSVERLARVYDPLTACKLSFGLGVYLGLQYNKLNKMLEK
jgi:hypothetical protein